MNKIKLQCFLENVSFLSFLLLKALNIISIQRYLINIKRWV